MNEIRFLAEWESAEAILLALPHEATDWNYILPEIHEQYRLIVRTLTAHGEHVILLARDRAEALRLVQGTAPGRLTVIETDFNDTWTRDYGPLSVIRNGRLRALDFGFNGWGLKFAADRDNLVNLRLAECGAIPEERYRNERSFILEGGSVETDGQGTILTTSRCLCSPNRNGGLSRNELTGILGQRLGAMHVLWLDYGELEGDDTDSHIDTLARLAPDDTILFTGTRDESDPHFESLLRMRAQLTLFRTADGRPYNLVELPLPAPLYDDDGCRLPATYTNYLVTPRNLFMPVYGNPALDDLACRTVRIAFPDHNIVPVDCRTLVWQHGSLHCATMQLPDGILNPVITE